MKVGCSNRRHLVGVTAVLVPARVESVVLRLEPLRPREPGVFLPPFVGVDLPVLGGSRQPPVVVLPRQLVVWPRRLPAPQRLRPLDAYLRRSGCDWGGACPGAGAPT